MILARTEDVLRATAAELSAATGRKITIEYLLLAELTDDQLDSKIPGAPWADGTVGGIMAANADHGRTHFKWAKEGTLAPR